MVILARTVKSGLLFCWMHVQRQAGGGSTDGHAAAVQQTMFVLLGEHASLVRVLDAVRPDSDLTMRLFLVCRCHANVLLTAPLLCYFISMVWRQDQNGKRRCIPIFCNSLVLCACLQPLLHDGAGGDCPGPHAAPAEDHSVLQEAQRPV
jgi:hypothetical protein